MLLVHAGDGTVEKTGTDLYTSTLSLMDVAEGVYVCLATNTAGGFNYESTRLMLASAVDGKESSSRPVPSLIMYLVIGKLSIRDLNPPLVLTMFQFKIKTKLLRIYQ